MLAALPADGADPIGRQLLQTHRGSAYHNWCSVRRQTDACRNAVPVAADQRVAARMTMGGLTGRIMNIAGIDIAKACIRGDPPRRAQRLRWCRWMIHQLPVRMKGREMQRRVGAEPIHYPGALRFNFTGRVVLAGNEQGSNLEPNLGLMLQVLKRLEDGSELARAEILVKSVGEAFEVDIGGVHVPKKFDPWFGRNITRADSYRLDTPLATSLRHIAISSFWGTNEKSWRGL